MTYLVSDADISQCGQYRYKLTRVWNPALPDACFIGLNPSTADADEDDPTIRRCVAFARAWGLGGLVMVNLWPYRATDPQDLKLFLRQQNGLPAEVDRQNWLTVEQAVNACVVRVAAWGNDGLYRSRSAEARKILDWKKLSVLKINHATGEPAHPLYLKDGLQPVPIGAVT